MNAKNLANNCIVCGGETSPLFDEEIKVVYDVCTVCGYTHKQPVHHVDHETEKKLYDHHNNSIENEGYVNMFKRFLDAAVTPYVTTGKALDFGSGPGPVLFELLKRAGYDADHTDPYYHPNPGFLDTQYDLITSTEVFEHLSDPIDVMRRLTDCMKAGGTLAIMTSLRPENDDAFLRWWYRRDQTHIGFFTLKAFKELIKPLPLKLIYTNHTNYFTFKKD